MAVDILCKDRTRQRETYQNMSIHNAIRKYKEHLTVLHDCLMIAVSDDYLMRVCDGLMVDRFKCVLVKICYMDVYGLWSSCHRDF